MTTLLSLFGWKYTPKLQTDITTVSDYVKIHDGKVKITNPIEEGQVIQAKMVDGVLVFVNQAADFGQQGNLKPIMFEDTDDVDFTIIEEEARIRVKASTVGYTGDFYAKTNDIITKIPMYNSEGEPLTARNGLVKISGGLRLTFDNIANAPVEDTSSLPGWNSFFDLPQNGTPFTAVKVSGNAVDLFGATNIRLAPYLFTTDLTAGSKSVSLLKIEDTCGCVKSASYNCFGDHEGGLPCENLSRAYLPSLKDLNGEYLFSGCYSLTDLTLDFDHIQYLPNGTFMNCQGITAAMSFAIAETAGNETFLGCYNIPSFYMPLLNYAGDYCFYNTMSVAIYSFPSLVYAGKGCMQNLYSDICTEIDLPSCISVGDECFSGNQYANRIYLPVIENLGTTAALIYTTSLFDLVNNYPDTTENYTPAYPVLPVQENDGVFRYIGQNINVELTINPSLLTINNGLPENDISDLIFFSEITSYAENSMVHTGSRLTIIPYSA